MSYYTSKMILKIPFHDLDPMNIVWHGNYIKYMEQARCDLFSKLNYTYLDMRDDLYMYPVAKMSTKFIKPAKFNQEIMIKTELLEIEPAMVIIYKIFDLQTNEKIFEAKTLQIAVNIETNQSVYTAPKRLIKILEDINEK